MTAFFAWHRKLTQRNISSRPRSRNKREKIWEKNLFGKLELSKEIFLSQEYPDFWSKFQKFGKLISNYSYAVDNSKYPFLTYFNQNPKCNARSIHQIKYVTCARVLQYLKSYFIVSRKLVVLCISRWEIFFWNVLKLPPLLNFTFWEQLFSAYILLVVLSLI